MKKRQRNAARAIGEDEGDGAAEADATGPEHGRQGRVVGVRAAELAGITNVYEATVNRDQIIRLMASNPQ